MDLFPQFVQSLVIGIAGPDLFLEHLHFAAFVKTLLLQPICQLVISPFVGTLQGLFNCVDSTDLLDNQIFKNYEIIKEELKAITLIQTNYNLLFKVVITFLDTALIALNTKQMRILYQITQLLTSLINSMKLLCKCQMSLST